MLLCQDQANPGATRGAVAQHKFGRTQLRWPPSADDAEAHQGEYELTLILQLMALKTRHMEMSGVIHVYSCIFIFLHVHVNLHTYRHVLHKFSLRRVFGRCTDVRDSIFDEAVSTSTTLYSAASSENARVSS